MNSRQISRVAGIAFVLYIVAGVSAMVLSSSVGQTVDADSRFAALIAHESNLRAASLCGLIGSLCAIVLGVSLNALLRAQDRWIAQFGLLCRTLEGAIGLIIPDTLMKLWIAHAHADRLAAVDSLVALDQFLSALGSASFVLSALMFSLGSCAFCYLFLRARSIPAWLSVLGLAASLLVLMATLRQLATGISAGFAIWLPMLVFELILAGWLVFAGVEAGRSRAQQSGVHEDPAS